MPGVSRISVSESAGESCTIAVKEGHVRGLILLPERVNALFCFAQGAGAGMAHPFMEKVSANLLDKNIGTLRYQFPYVEKCSRRPDPKPVLIETVKAACEYASSYVPGLPIFGGGKSMGGRMTSHASADGKIDFVRGLIFLGFPLHPPGKPSVERADHLKDIRQPMLFIQGTRDRLADLDLLKPICEQLGTKTKLTIIDGADHSFGFLKNKGPANVVDLLAATIAEWISRLV